MKKLVSCCFVKVLEMRFIKKNLILKYVIWIPVMKKALRTILRKAFLLLHGVGDISNLKFLRDLAKVVYYSTSTF